MAKDPVCGMDVNPASASEHAEHGGTTFYFCCAHCRQQFQQDPAKYAKA